MNLSTSSCFSNRCIDTHTNVLKQGTHVNSVFKRIIRVYMEIGNAYKCTGFQNSCQNI